jgi:hypothetical protein
VSDARVSGKFGGFAITSNYNKPHTISRCQCELLFKESFELQGNILALYNIENGKWYHLRYPLHDWQNTPVNITLP